MLLSLRLIRKKYCLNQIQEWKLNFSIDRECKFQSTFKKMAKYSCRVWLICLKQFIAFQSFITYSFKVTPKSNCGVVVQVRAYGYSKFDIPPVFFQNSLEN